MSFVSTDQLNSGKQRAAASKIWRLCKSNREREVVSRTAQETSSYNATDDTGGYEDASLASAFVIETRRSCDGTPLSGNNDNNNANRQPCRRILSEPLQLRKYYGGQKSQRTE